MTMVATTKKMGAAAVVSVVFACLAVAQQQVQVASAFISKPSSFGLTSTMSSTATTTQLGLFDFLKEGKKALVKSLAGEFDEAAVKARLDNLVSDNKVLMLSFTTCPFCIKAKECLDSKSAKYRVVELDQDADGKAIRAVMGETLGRTSVPAIWIDGQFVGGCNDGPMGGLLKLDEAGKLDPLLKSVNAI